MISISNLTFLGNVGGPGRTSGELQVGKLGEFFEKIKLWFYRQLDLSHHPLFSFYQQIFCKIFL